MQRSQIRLSTSNKIFVSFDFLFRRVPYNLLFGRTVVTIIFRCKVTDWHYPVAVLIRKRRHVTGTGYLLRPLQGGGPLCPRVFWPKTHLGSAIFSFPLHALFMSVCLGHLEWLILRFRMWKWKVQFLCTIFGALFLFFYIFMNKILQLKKCPPPPPPPFWSLLTEFWDRI